MFILDEAILHVYDALSMTEVLSESTLNLNDDVLLDYISHHIERGADDPGASRARFSQTSAVPAQIERLNNGEENFVDFSKWLAGLFFSELRELEVGENYDLIIVRFHSETNAIPYLGILALADKLAYTHRIDADEDGGVSATISVHRTIMPQPTQRIKGFAFINLEGLGIRLYDIRVKVDKERVAIFEEMVLGCIPEPSSRDAYKEIRSMTLAVADSYSQDGVEALVRAKNFVSENADNNDTVETHALARETFPNSVQMQSSFMDEVVFRNMPETLVVERGFAKKQTATHQLSADNGIEIKIPAELMDDPDYVDIHLEEDGTLTVTLRGIENLTGK